MRPLPGIRRSGPEPVDVAVGARMRIRRRMLELSQTQVANGLGITFQQIQKYERGSNRVSASMLVKIAAILKTSVAALVGEDGSEPVDPLIVAQFATPGAPELLNVFGAIKSRELRDAFVVLAKAIAITPRIRAAS
jgi:transcriptional regulator with XRE-family HTH domain